VRVQFSLLSVREIASQVVTTRASACDAQMKSHGWDVPSLVAPHAEAAQAAEYCNAGQPATVTELWTGYQSSEARPT